MVNVYSVRSGSICLQIKKNTPYEAAQAFVLRVMDMQAVDIDDVIEVGGDGLSPQDQCEFDLYAILNSLGFCETDKIKWSGNSNGHTT